MRDRNDLATSERAAAGLRERTPSRSHWAPRAIRRPILWRPPAFRLCSVRSSGRRWLTAKTRPRVVGSKVKRLGQ